MSKIKVKFKDGEKFAKALRKMAREAEGDALLKGLRAGEMQAIGYVKVNINKQGLIKTGNLINSVEEDRHEVSKTKASVFFGPHVVYAAIHEFGGIIRSTSGRGLAFEIDGHLVITQSVTIPARPYLRPAIDEHQAEIMETLLENLREAVAEAFHNG